MTSTHDGPGGRPADDVAREKVAQGDVPGEKLVAGPEAGGREPLEVVEVRTGMFGATGSGDTSGYGGLVRPVVLPGPSARPYGGWFDEAVDVLAEVLAEGGVRFEDAVEQVVVDPPGRHAELTLHVRRDHVVTVARALRDEQDLRFELSMGVSGVHYPHDVGRELHAVYHLTSVTHGRSLRLEVAVPDADPHIPSTTSVYPSNDWHERETWDFFGIVFDGHPALARIEMPDDWPGHPQRKDYPLGGIPVEYKGATVPPPDQRRSYS
ncbi:NADH-quinone oxidoreductase subunit C [Oerskovia turbata]|uniref:NADH-quinone oxidoreductase subunit C n=1 Tax=Oerskovia turbata TaxID=1713 RepID=A0A4Q1KTA8_9CELL|nr:NADH-quinone oxidoreductase subunit C [Oerskovia turbata]RXR32850.1 NADH-quinone oxidoreductase subunit C [Oerskovia turbata]TGJ95155.1 NADH-quinone oxidoreductase subunit C [Actinotalea fermentans ATCC 43279 = JCM 9966 = DSM 3133]